MRRTHGYYPVLLDLEDKLCVVVGGGGMAREKAEALLGSGARVRLVAAELRDDRLRELAGTGEIDHVARAYRAGDLEDAYLVIAERGPGDRDHRVWREADDRRIPVNVVDDVPHCSFIVPSIVRRGDLVVSVSTSGRAPTLAVRLRQWLEEELGGHHARFLELAARVRAPLAERRPDLEERRRIWYRLVDSEVLELLRQGHEQRARARLAEIVGFDVEAS